MTALESAAIAAWYSSRPEIRRLLAIRDQEGLRVLVQLDPAPDSNETHPAWMANRDEWTEELQWRTAVPLFGSNASTRATTMRLTLGKS